MFTQLSSTQKHLPGMGRNLHTLLLCQWASQKRSDFVLCGKVELVLISSSQGWAMMSQVSSAGRVPTGMEKQSMQWEGAQAPPEGARGYQQQSRDQS